MEKINDITVTIGFLASFLLVSCGTADKTEDEEAVEEKVEKAEPREVKRVAKREALPNKNRLPAPEKSDFQAPEDVAAPPEDAEKTESGLASKLLKPGTGKVHPEATNEVSVHYTGWTTDGKMFDSSKKRGRPSKFRLNKVIAGWTEGVQLMVEGEERRFWIPQDLAYKGKRPPLGMLVFDIELIEIVK
jgi:peptidylprolyl isomerase